MARTEVEVVLSCIVTFVVCLQCPELIRSGVQIKYEGISINDFQLGVNRFKEIVAREINTDCLLNVSDFMACCNQTATLELYVINRHISCCLYTHPTML